VGMNSSFIEQETSTEKVVDIGSLQTQSVLISSSRSTTRGRAGLSERLREISTWVSPSSEVKEPDGARIIQSRIRAVTYGLLTLNRLHSMTAQHRGDHRDCLHAVDVCRCTCGRSLQSRESQLLRRGRTLGESWSTASLFTRQAG